MGAPGTLAVFCVLAACACSGGSGSTVDAPPWTRQEPPSSRDVPPPTRDDPGPGRDTPGGACAPCGGAFTCSLATGPSVIVASKSLASGACALFDSQTDIIVLECGGAVAVSGRDVGTWRDDGQGGVIVRLTTGTISCRPG